jgi:PKD repeat protein
MLNKYPALFGVAMRKSTILIVLLLVLSPVSAQLLYRETEKIALNVSTFDPDADALVVTYSPPLDTKGEWQTTYGDAGVYKINITVSDGQLSTSEEILLVVSRKEEPPAITTQRPRTGMLSMNEGKKLHFTVSATDMNKDALTYKWEVDGESASSGNSFTYSPGYDEQGNHTILLMVSDGQLSTTRSWTVLVKDVDLDTILASYQDITASEGELIRIPLPDAAYYGISYAISSPLEKGFWKTDYNSSGLYKVTVHLFGKGYDEKKTIRVRVLNVDQPPAFSIVPAQTGYEANQLSFTIFAYDPDGDDVSIVLTNPPQGAVFSKGTFTWIPSYDEVLHTGFQSGLSRDFHLLSKTFQLEFVATSNNLSSTLTVPVTIFNTNRAPRLSTSKPLVLKEGDMFLFEANAIDPDNDPLSFTYESTLKRGQAIPYDKSGSHVLKVTVSDGFLQDTMFIPITVENTNRPPILLTSPISIRENQTLLLELKGRDDDNDPLSYALFDAPEGINVDGSTLHWTPPFHIAKGEPAAVTSLVEVSDGQSTGTANLSIIVEDVNRAPQLNEPALERLVAQRGQPITLRIDATDPDGDALAYTWRFGWLDSHEGGSTHIRTYVSSGEKKVTASATDGKETVTKDFVIIVR